MGWPVNTSKCYKQVNNVLHTPPIGENEQPLHIGNFSITVQDIFWGNCWQGWFKDLCEGSTTSLKLKSSVMDNTWVKCKTFSKNKDMVENIEKGTKFMITSIDKIHTMNMEIEAQCI